MKKIFSLAAAAVALFIVPAYGTTFANLTTIYVASGVLNTADADNEGNATVVHCSNISGSPVQIRFLFVSNAGVLRGSHLVSSLPNGHTYTAATHGTNVFGDTSVGAGPIVQGRLTVQANNSAVFCTAMIVDAAATVPNGIDLHMVRLHAHPNTVE